MTNLPDIRDGPRRTVYVPTRVLLIPRYHNRYRPTETCLGDMVAERLHEYNRQLVESSHEGNGLFYSVDADAIKFSDSSAKAVLGRSVRRAEIYILHSAQADKEAHVSIAERMSDALRRAEAEKIFLFDTYEAAFRQDELRDRESLDARIVADRYRNATVNRVFTFDPHTQKVQLAFARDCPLEPFPLNATFADYIISNKPELLENLTICSPDFGAYGRSEELANLLGTDLVALRKDRVDEDKAEIVGIVGDIERQINDRDILLRDDICGTGGTLKEATQYLKSLGARNVYACISHLDLCKGSNLEDEISARRKVMESGMSGVIGTNTVVHDFTEREREFFEVVDVSDLISRMIYRHSQGRSMSKFYTELSSDVRDRRSLLQVA